MVGPTGQVPQRTLTPAVLASALFVAACAVFAVTFTAGRGGLEMPTVSRAPVAVASPGAAPSGAAPTSRPTSAPTAGSTTPPPTALPPSPDVVPTPAPTVAPTAPAPSFDPDDPLLALPECPGHPGCFMYVVQRNDTLSGVVSRYLLSISVVLALNPQLTDLNVVVTGSTLYLGRDPFVRLDPCPDQPACSLYVVAAGDSLGEIAARYGLTVDQVRKQNPGMPRPIQPGQVIELPHPG